MLSRECSAKVTNLYWISPTLQKQIAWRVICDWPDIWSFRQRSRTYAVVVRMNFVQPTARQCGGGPKNQNQTNLPFHSQPFSEMALNISAVRDTKWLTLEVCRQFQRGNCSRGDEECKFAHPPKSCQVENGRVIACFDSLKVGSGANTYKSCFVAYVVDVSVGWCRMLLATPTNKSQIMSTPCLIPHHVLLELVTKLKRCQIYIKKWQPVGLQPVDSLCAQLPWVTPGYFNLLWHVHCRATIHFCRRIMLSHCFCSLTVDMLFSTCPLPGSLLCFCCFILAPELIKRTFTSSSLSYFTYQF